MTVAPRGTLVFDLDGTLVDSAPDLASSLDILFAEMNLEPIGLAGTRRLIGNGIAALVGRALEERHKAVDPMVAAGAIDRFMQIYSSQLVRQTRVYPGVVTGLRRFAREGWSLAVCTNKAESLACKILADRGLLSIFSVVAGPDTFDCCKPDPRHLLRTIETAAGCRGRAVLIGDSEIDIATAKAASIPIIAVSYGYCRSPLDELQPDAIVDAFGQIPAAVARIIR